MWFMGEEDNEKQFVLLNRTYNHMHHGVQFMNRTQVMLPRLSIDIHCSPPINIYRKLLVTLLSDIGLKQE